jgi:ubiquinone/menaquinone biosynthesis C-methylase UbiE
MFAAFHNPLTPFYHLIHEAGRAGIDRQGSALDAPVPSLVPYRAQVVLDVACGTVDGRASVKATKRDTIRDTEATV